MPLVLRIDNMDSLPDGGPVRYEVDRRGLDIGRDPYLDWTLPDPERFISGKHCEVHFRDGGYWLHDVSTNGTSLNGRGGRLTEPHRLEDGDRIYIGHYIVAVELSGEAAQPPAPQGAQPSPGGRSADPWGDVGDTAAAVDRRDFAARARTSQEPSAPRGPADLAEEQISWSVGRVTESAAPADDDIWAAPPAPRDAGTGGDDWGWTPPDAPADSPRVAGSGAGSDTGREPPLRAPPPKPASDAVSGPGPQSVEAGPVAPLPGQPDPTDPTHASPSDGGLSEPGSGGVPDPAAPHDTRPGPDPAPPESSAPLPDRPLPHVGPFGGLAEATAEPAFDEMPAPQSPRQPGSAQEEPRGDPFGQLGSAAAPRPAPEAPAQSTSQPAAHPDPRAAEPSTLADRWTGGDEPSQPSTRASAAPGPAPAGQGGDFIAAFERGAGLPAGSVAGRAGEAFGEELGALMRLVAQNLQAMLAARAETKSAMRSADRTMIGALENNPLKFSPTPEEALRIMFGAKSRSYLDATKTVESSFQDLQKHQLQTFAAMQQALQALIEDLDPKSIEDATSKDSGLAGMVGSRRAKYWDTYTERFRAKSGRHERGMIDAFMILFAEMYDRQR